MTRQPPSKWLPSYLAVVVLWGSSFAFIKLGLETLTPLGIAFGRTAIAAVTLLVISAVTRTGLAPRRLWGFLLINGLLAAFIPWLLTAFAENDISSALAAIVASTGPLFTLLAVFIAFPEERPTRDRIIGLVVGFLGMLVVVGVWQGIGVATGVGILACLAANMIWSWSLPFSRRYLTGGARASTLPPISLATGMFATAAVVTVPLTILVPVTKAPMTSMAVISILVLGVLSSGVAAVMNFRVIGRADATTASTTLYLAPLVALIIGSTYLGEAISWNEPVGGVIILLGAALAQGLLRRPTQWVSPRG